MVILSSLLAAVLLDLIGFNPIRMLFWSAVINGLLAPVLLLLIWLVIRDKGIMKENRASALEQVGLIVAIVLMTGAGIAMFVT
jgi:Mn2+/Fe2+ NRAMP family transporter